MGSEMCIRDRWNSVYVEPSYTMSMADDSDDEGTLNLGLAWRF